MTRLRISLGIPVYNQVSTIAETIASVLAQIEPFDEILVVDNHSTDGTAEVLKHFGKNISVITPSKHLKMVENWNFCVSQMTGEWFSLLSGDDLVKPGFAQAIRKAAHANSTAALLRTDWDVIDSNGKILNVQKQLSVAHITKTPKNWREQVYGPKVCFAAFSAKREFWAAAGGFPCDFHLFQDWMFWLKIAPFGSFCRIPESLAQYRNQDRPKLESQRIGLRILDEYKYLVEILPQLPWERVSDVRLIKIVRQRRLISLLNYLTDYDFDLTREQLVILYQLADIAQIMPVFQRWILKKENIELERGARIFARAKQIAKKILKA